MTMEELESALIEIIPSGFAFETGKNGQLVILTSLEKTEEGELIASDEDFDAEYDPDFEELPEEFDPIDE